MIIVSNWFIVTIIESHNTGRVPGLRVETVVVLVRILTVAYKPIVKRNFYWKYSCKIIF